MSIIKEISTVASVAMPVDERWTVRRCRYTSQGGSAARLCIASGLHGDEMMGQLICYNVAQRIASDPDALRGTVDIYPMLNPLGLDVGERLVPSATRLDMNRAFPGSPDGTVLEAMCYHIMQDMLGADLVLDIHASTQNKSELYEARVSAKDSDKLVAIARTLCPEFIWIYPDKNSYNASLSGALWQAGTPALILEADERHRRPQEIADGVVNGIFCKMREMGIWTGEAPEAPAPDVAIPCAKTSQDIYRVTCENPGVYVPLDHIGKSVEEGQTLGRVIDALEGVTREEVKAPASGLVFSQRSYSAVYPGTLIARILRKEQA